MKLMSMTDFVLQEQKKCNNDSSNYGRASLIAIWNYANFLKQPLTLEMFVPSKLVNGDWIILEEPSHAFTEAKKLVLFNNVISCSVEGNPFVRLNNIEFHLHGMSVERLVSYELELTESAKQRILS